MTAYEFEKYIKLIRNGKRIEAEILREKDIPDVLIKHFYLKEDDSDEKKFYTLENNMLWFSAISKLNDPYEFKGMVVNEKAFKEKGYPDNVIDYFKEFLRMEEYGVVCLSGRTVDYLPMWAYYTNNYHGFCVEYEVVNKPCIHKVQYEKKRIPIASLFFQLKEALSENIRNGKKSSPEAESIASLIRQNLYIKGESWAHEQEYRIAMPIDNIVGKNYEISTFGLRAKRIIAGVNCSEANINRLNHISNIIGCGNIFISYLSNEKYGMEIERLLEK
ncbi:MAG: DUF2971 domain-containing protein [Lachnospiraceae bacterium]|nr:DUF2971 domain-containing protein [Lachnospiraceae bacterium]